MLKINIQPYVAAVLRFSCATLFPALANAYITIQKTKFFSKIFFSKCEKIQCPADLVTFTGEIFNGKLQFLCCVYCTSDNLDET